MELPEKEKQEQLDALVRWFESQHISWYDGCKLMMTLLGGWIGYFAKDKEHLNLGIDSVHRSIKRSALKSWKYFHQ